MSESFTCHDCKKKFIIGENSAIYNFGGKGICSYCFERQKSRELQSYEMNQYEYKTVMSALYNHRQSILDKISKMENHQAFEYAMPILQIDLKLADDAIRRLLSKKQN